MNSNQQLIEDCHAWKAVECVFKREKCINRIKKEHPLDHKDKMETCDNGYECAKTGVQYCNLFIKMRGSMYDDQ
jgi:hypothetical protein